MNYADMALGTWYPSGGMFQIVDGLMKLAAEAGVRFRFNAPVERIQMNGPRVSGVLVNGKPEETDFLVASADYNHVEQQLMPDSFRQYTAAYWNSRVLAPSALIFYLGLNKKITGLAHHTLFFDTEFQAHAREIFERPQWPTAPQFYINCPSVTDSTVCADGHENLTILIPVATGLNDDDAIRENCFNAVMSRMENILGENIRDHIVFKRSYAQRDFVSDYNAFKGNAYGLANTLFQTANLKPSIVSAGVKNLFYTGHLTVPGPGVPPSIISGQIAARELIKRNCKPYEIPV